MRFASGKRLETLAGVGLLLSSALAGWAQPELYPYADLVNAVNAWARSDNGNEVNEYDQRLAVNAVDGAGLAGLGQDTDVHHMWCGLGAPYGRNNPRFYVDFGTDVNLTGLRVWNYNEANLSQERGIASAVVQYCTNAVVNTDEGSWVGLGTFTFHAAPGTNGYNTPDTFSLPGISTRYLRFVGLTFFSNNVGFNGLSQVQGIQASAALPLTNSVLLGLVDYYDNFDIPGSNQRNNTADLSWYTANNPAALNLSNGVGSGAAFHNTSAGVGFRNDTTATRKAAGNAGAATGVLDFENGGAQPYILYQRNHDRFGVQFDALLASDRMDIVVSGGTGATVEDSRALCLFVRPAGNVDIYNSVLGQSPTAWNIGSQTQWVNLAVMYDRSTTRGGSVELFANQQSLGSIDLTGTIYAGLISDQWVGVHANGSGGVVDNLKVGVDDFPYDGDNRVDRNASLSWHIPAGAVSYDVYLGTNHDMVAVATTNSSGFQGFSVTNIFVPATPLMTRQTYFWRIDTHTANYFIPGPVRRFHVSADMGVLPGQSALIQAPASLSDTFSLASNANRDNAHSFSWFAANKPTALAVEQSLGASWSASSPNATYFANGVIGFGDPGQDTGMLLLRNDSISAPYGGRAPFVVQFDACIPADDGRVEVNCGSASGLTGAAGTLSVFIRKNGPFREISLSDSSDGETAGFNCNNVFDAEWHNYAVVFDSGSKKISTWIDGNPNLNGSPVCQMELTQFAGGIYQARVNGSYIGIGGSGSGNVYIDNVDVGPLVYTRTHHPAPVNGDGAASPVNLQWSPAAGNPTAYDVYLARDYSSVANATTNSVCFLGRQAGTSYYFGGGVQGQDYYWRVDQINGAAAIAGDIWRFTIYQNSFMAQGLASPTQVVYMVSTDNDNLNVTLRSLQGVVAKRRPEILFNDNSNWQAALNDLSATYGIPIHSASSLANLNESDADALLRLYRADYQGYILYDLAANPESLLVATAMAGLSNCIVADVSVVPEMKAHGIPMLMDVRARNTRWLYECYWGSFRHNVYGAFDPTSYDSLCDLLVAANCGVFYNADGLFNNELLHSVVPDACVYGWGNGLDNYYSGEGGNVGVLSTQGACLAPLDAAKNLSLLSRMAAYNPPISFLQPNRPTTYTPETNVHYVTFLMGDGNPVVEGLAVSTNLGNAYAMSGRGRICMNWQTPAYLTKLAPATLSWHYRTATTNDHYVDFYSGLYTHPERHPALDDYCRQLNDLMVAADQRVTVIGHAVPTDPYLQSQWSQNVLSKYAAAPGIRGVYTWPITTGDGLIFWSGGKPFVNHSYLLQENPDGSPAAFGLSHQGLAAAINAASTIVNSPQAYSFVYIGDVQPQRYTWAEEAVALFGPQVRVVSMEEFIERIYMNRPGTLLGNAPVASAGVTISCDDAYHLYLNGFYVGQGSNWTLAQQFTNLVLQPGTNILGVSAMNVNGFGGLIANINLGGQTVGTGAGCKVSLTAPPGWNAAAFDDSSWASATDEGAYGVAPWGQEVSGMPTNTTAHWIWSASSNHMSIYIRIPIVITAPNPPAAPTGLTATAQPDNSVSLTWANNATNASAIKIWRTVAGGIFSEIAWVPAGTNSFLDTSAANRTSYYYKVSANNAGGDSPYSNQAEAMTGGDVIFVSGDDGYQLYLNGAYIGTGNTWWNAQAYSVSFQPGTNEICVQGDNAFSYAGLLPPD